MIEIESVSKSYGSIQALQDISFNVDAGQIVGLLGPNGAGKSTAIKIITGYLQPDSGTVQVDGLDVLTQTHEVQARLGYLPENTPLYPDLSVQAYLRFMADLRQIPPARQPALLSQAIYATGLEPYLTRPIGYLSKGLRQRVGLAQAIFHQPKLIILDEPTVGLDPTQVVEMRSLIQRLSTHSTILFSSHILSEVEALCDRVIVIMNGQVRADANLADLSASEDVILVLQEEREKAKSLLTLVKGVQRVEALKRDDAYPAYRVVGQKNTDLSPAIYDLSREHDWPLRELRRDVRTLESVFNELANAA